MSGEKRFSPSAYSAKLKNDDPNESTPKQAGTVPVVRMMMKDVDEADGDQARKPSDFAKAADDMRAYLASPRGLTEEERREYGEKLNRAVLGYSGERKEILAFITDRLLRLRIHELPGTAGGYPSLAEALFAEVIGLGALELVLQERIGLEEIQVVGTRIYVMREGRVSRSPYRFQSLKEVERIQQNLVLYNNDRINPRKRWAEVMLRDGTRVTMTGFGFTSQPTLTLRFYASKAFRLKELISPECGTMNAAMAAMLRAALDCRYNLVIIGPTGSGKTHLLKALIAELPDDERLVTLESRLEMMLSRDFPNKNAVEYEMDEDDPLHRSKQAFKLALRQSPDRIIHAEIRDDDANIYVRACTRGHSGSMTTVHANRLEDIPDTICDMCMLDGRAMNPDRLSKRIAGYVTQIGIEMQVLDGKRRIVRIGRIRWDRGQASVLDWAVYVRGSGSWHVAASPDPDDCRRFAEAGFTLSSAGFAVTEAEAGEYRTEIPMKALQL
ncbi:ATPase, T2SS/T4P/T4SS family [Paenibacillus humicus]|uniref:ATPase, T2SS/T4P/T4SS family n=1 Tax=Paenibacillus humicus TaxID=412861 RepID=UPI003F169D14